MRIELETLMIRVDDGDLRVERDINSQIEIM